MFISKLFSDFQESNHGLYIVHGFQPKSEKFEFGKKRNAMERAPQEEQNGTNFSSVASSCEE